MLNCAVFFATGIAESATCTVNDEVPGVVGVPEITPLGDNGFKPAGKLPCVRLQV